MFINKLKKPNEEQKEYLLSYMECNSNFALDKFEAVDGLKKRAQRWLEVAEQLNNLGSTKKDASKWRKFWLDQRSHIKKKDFLFRSASKNGAHVPLGMKPLSDYEKRVIRLITRSPVVGNFEVFNMDDKLEEESFLEEELIIKEEYEEKPTYIPECTSIEIDYDMSASVSPCIPTPESMKLARSKRKPKSTAIEERLLQIEAEKLEYIKKEFEFKQLKFQEEKDWRIKLLELENKKLDVERQKIEIEEKKMRLL